VISIKSDEEFDAMREAGRIVAKVHAYMRENVRPGVTTREIDDAAETIIRENGATPEFKGYHGFPASVCASVNHEVVHGIPGPRRLEEGDIIATAGVAFLRDGQEVRLLGEHLMRVRR